MANKSEQAKTIEALSSACDAWNGARTLRLDLLKLIETGSLGKDAAYALQGIAEDASVLTRFRKLTRFGPASQRLAAAIHAHTHLGIPRAKALCLTAAKSSDLDAAEALARSAKVDLGEFSRAVDEAVTPWVAELRHELEDVTVHIEERALLDLLFAAAETYSVPKKGAAFTEVYGVCFGTRTLGPRPTGGNRRDVHYNVEHCVPQLRAKMNSGSVQWDPRSIKVAVSVARAAKPNWTVLGDFHSHPESSSKELLDIKQWEFSPGDQKDVGRFLEVMRECGEAPVLGIVVAIAAKKRGPTASNPRKHGDHTVQFVIAKHKLVIGAYVHRRDGKYRPAKLLRCASINKD